MGKQKNWRDSASAGDVVARIDLHLAAAALVPSGADSVR